MAIAAEVSSGPIELVEKIVSLNRVAKVTKGGRSFSFSALVVVGDGQGRVGAGMGKSSEVPDAIRKGVDQAKKNMIDVPIVGTTVPHQVITKFGAAEVLLKPAMPGTGVISGGGMRAVIEAAGIRDIVTKSLGSNNAINVVYATVAALQQMRTLQAVADIRGKRPEEVVGAKRAEQMLAGRTHVAPRVQAQAPQNERSEGRRRRAESTESK